MAVYKCAGRKLLDEDGDPYCQYEDSHRWIGRCPGCNRYYDCDKIGSDSTRKARTTLATLGNIELKPRISTGLLEIDEVVGKPPGLVEGSTYIISGPPGGGKTTLLLTIANHVATARKPVLYTSGEQKAEDVAVIAQRLGAANPHVEVMGMQGDMYEVGDAVEKVKPSILIVDSLQTAFMDDCKADEGSAEQCKAVANYLTALGKRENAVILLICHINKAGDAAGPLAAQHLCDTVLELDPCPVVDEDDTLDEETKDWKMLSTGKNRNGESGASMVFELTGRGIKVVPKKRKRSKLELV